MTLYKKIVIITKIGITKGLTMNLKNNLGKIIDLYQFKDSTVPLERGYLVFSKSKNMYLVVFIDEILLSPNFISIDERINKIEVLNSAQLDYSLSSLKKDILNDNLYEWEELSLEFESCLSSTSSCVNCKNFSLLNFFCHIHYVNKEAMDFCSDFSEI